MASKKKLEATEELREFGLKYPGAHIKSPWPGHADLAVNDKTFAYLSAKGEPFSIGCKLPNSNALALSLPFTAPTPYGLGKSGWVTAKLEKGDSIPLEMFKEWIDESYRAQAPKKLVLMMGGDAPATSVKRPPPQKSQGLLAREATTRKRAAKKTATRRRANKR